MYTVGADALSALIVYLRVLGLQVIPYNKVLIALPLSEEG